MWRHSTSRDAASSMFWLANTIWKWRAPLVSGRVRPHAPFTWFLFFFLAGDCAETIVVFRTVFWFFLGAVVLFPQIVTCLFNLLVTALFVPKCCFESVLTGTTAQTPCTMSPRTTCSPSHGAVSPRPSNCPSPRNAILSPTWSSRAARGAPPSAESWTIPHLTTCVGSREGAGVDLWVLCSSVSCRARS